MEVENEADNGYVYIDDQNKNNTWQRSPQVVKRLTTLYEHCTCLFDGQSVQVACGSTVRLFVTGSRCDDQIIY